MGKQVDFSLPTEELFSAGSFFTPGPYTIEQAHFTEFDFKKGRGNESLCLCLILQPLDGDGKPVGEVQEPRYWPVNNKMKDDRGKFTIVTVEGTDPIKGRKGCFAGLELTDQNKHGKLAASDFKDLIDSMRKAEVDMDAIGNDITTLEGQSFEFGVVAKADSKKRTAIEEAEGDNGDDDNAKKKYPKEIIVVTSVIGRKAKKSSKKDDDDDKPARGGKSGKGKNEPTAEDVLKSFLEENVCVKANAKEGVAHMNVKMEVAGYCKEQGLDADMTKEVVTMFNDKEGTLPTILSTLGWSYNSKTKLIEQD